MSEWDVISLLSIIDIYGEEKAREIVSGFVCSKDRDLQDFLTERSIEFEKRWLSRSWLIFEKDSVDVIAYFSVAMKCMRLPDASLMSNRLWKRLNVDGGADVAQSYLVAQLGRSDDSERGIGPRIINCAMAVLGTASNYIGCRTVRLDCKDDLIGFYEGNGFQLIDKNEGNNLNRMVRMLNRPESAFEIP